jgi:hypothetical protein
MGQSARLVAGPGVEDLRHDHRVVHGLGLEPEAGKERQLEFGVVGGDGAGPQRLPEWGRVYVEAINDVDAGPAVHRVRRDLEESDAVSPGVQAGRLNIETDQGSFSQSAAMLAKLVGLVT